MTFFRPPEIEEIRRQARKITDEQKQQNILRTKLQRDPGNDLFLIKPADQWLKEEYSKPPARQLLGSLWYEHELCILFADTNIGKSILAVQIGYNLGKQSSIEPFGNHLDEPVNVLYIDFELTAGQFKARYSHPAYGVHHFGGHFIRAEFNPAGDNPLLYENYEEYVRQWIESSIRQTKAKVLIIDNITYLGIATGNAGSALPLMKSLKAIKTKYKLSVLVLAHTPKRSLYKPITVNDLQGSKMLINFADSAFALGQSYANSGLRYLKQIKQRNTASNYGTNNVCLFKLTKQLSFLSFEFSGYDTEQAHLQKVATSLSDEVKQQIMELTQQGLSQRQVANHLKVSCSTVSRVVNKRK